LVLVALAVAALVTAIFAGFYHAGYWGPARGHVMRFGPGYHGYDGGWGFFPGLFLFPLILLLILAVVFWRPWHRYYWHYGYGHRPGPWGRGYWGPGPYGPGPHSPGPWGRPGAGGPGGAGSPGAPGPGMGDPNAGPDVSGTTAPNADARDAGLWGWLGGPHHIFDEWHRRAHTGAAGAAQGAATTGTDAWAPPAGPPVPPEAASPVPPDAGPTVPPEASEPTPPTGGAASPPPGEPPAPPQVPGGGDTAT
jgi:hypothetical protein